MEAKQVADLGLDARACARSVRWILFTLGARRRPLTNGKKGKMLDQRGLKSARV